MRGDVGVEKTDSHPYFLLLFFSPLCFTHFCLFIYFSVALPLATYTDKDDEDGDHEGGGRCDGSQEQQVFVGFHDSNSCLAPAHSVKLQIKPCDQEKLQKYKRRRKRQNIKMGDKKETEETWHGS